MLSGLLRPDEVGHIIGEQLPASKESETLGGPIAESILRLADVGDLVVVESVTKTGCSPATIELRVQQLDGHRIDLIEVTVTYSDSHLKAWTGTS